MSKQPAPAIAEMLQELDMSRQILRIVFDNITSAIVLVAPDTRMIFVNKYAREGSVTIHGRPMEVGDSIMNYRLPGDDETHSKFKKNFERALQTRTAIIDEGEMFFPPLTFWIRTEFTPIFDHDKPVGVLLHFHNVTDRKKMETWTAQQADILNHIAWSQSHETRQPVATLLGLINILDKKSLTEENQKIIGLLEQTAHKLENVIRQNVIRANMGATRSGEGENRMQ
ncbi:PAS domain-containing protein [Chryseolinea sp. T2]|uniref:PAS domain-containing protein n=1 Tax=Chryseolinea sp. T2 TaxID=3129255 RepID=UPI00307703F1